MLSIGRLLTDSYTVRVPSYFMAESKKDLEDLIGPETKVILLEFSEAGDHEPDYERYWRAALRSGLPLVGIILHGQSVVIPTEFRELRVLDEREAISSGSFDDEASQQKVIAATNRITDAIHDAFESTLPSEAKHAFEQAIQEATAQVATDGTAPVLRSLQLSARAYAVARSMQSLRRMQQARDLAIAGQNRLAILTEGDGRFVGQLSTEQLATWDRALDAVDLQWLSARQKVIRLIADEDKLDVERLLEIMEGGWSLATAARDRQAIDHLRDTFAVALRIALRVLVKRANGGSRVASTLEQIAQLFGKMQHSDLQQITLGVAAQAWVASADGWLRGVYAIERAMQVPGKTFPVETRESVLASANAVRQRLESEVEELLNAGNEKAAESALSVVHRLCRSLPDHEKLAEMLTCATQLGSSPDRSSSSATEIAREAELLAQAYGRHDLLEVLHTGKPAGA